MFGENGNDQFTVRVAEDTKEIKALLEVGFEYVCQKDRLIFLSNSESVGERGAP